jgi:predicted metal-binding protein
MTTVFVCVTCRGPAGEDDRPGRRLFEALSGEPGVSASAVECLSVCKRPCTIALSAGGKWTYVIGDLDAETSAGDVIAMAARYGDTADGIVPWRERPTSFRKGVVSRIPPVG